MEPVLYISIAVIAGYLLTFVAWDNPSPILRFCSAGPVGVFGFSWLIWGTSFVLGFTGLAVRVAALITAAVAVSLGYRYKTALLAQFQILKEIHSNFWKDKPRAVIWTVFWSLVVFVGIRMSLSSCYYDDVKGTPHTSTGMCYGDWSVHLAYLKAMIHSGTLPPHNPLFMDTNLAYPMLSDMLSAALLMVGGTHRQMFVVPAIPLVLSTFGLVYCWGRWATKSIGMGLIVCALFICGGGLGFIYFWQDLRGTDQSLFSFLGSLPQDYTVLRHLQISLTNPITTMLFPQRAFLFGFPIGVLVLIGIGKVYRETATLREKIALGVLAGLLPFGHTHTFLALSMFVAAVGVFYCGEKWLGENKLKSAISQWLPSAIAWTIVSLPQIIYFKSHVAGNSGFLRWHFGFESGDANFAVYWLRNAGIFLIVWLIGSYKSRSIGRGLAFGAAFLFAISNMFAFAPWVWDNTKILIWWWIAGSPFAAFVIYNSFGNWRLWKTKSFAFGAALLLFSNLSGALDIFKYGIIGTDGIEWLSRERMENTRLVEKLVPHDARIISDLGHYNPAQMSGHGVFLCMPGFAYSHGYQDWYPRQRAVEDFMLGNDADAIVGKYRFTHAVISADGIASQSVNVRFLDRRYYSIYKSDTLRIYDLHRRADIDEEIDLPIGVNHNHRNERILLTTAATPSFNSDKFIPRGYSKPFTMTQWGSLRVPETGEYGFRVLCDDGARLWINGRPVVDDYNTGAPRHVEGIAILAEGLSDVYVEYMDTGGGAVLEIDWKHPGQTTFKRLVQSDFEPGRTLGGGGLLIKLFRSHNWSGPEYDRFFCRNFEEALSESFHRTTAGPFSITAHAFLYCPKPGIYKFFTESDDGSQLLVDDKLVVDNGGPHGPQERTGEIELTAGMHAVTVKYFDGGGGRLLRASWIVPGAIEKEPLEHDLLLGGPNFSFVGLADAESGLRAHIVPFSPPKKSTSGIWALMSSLHFKADNDQEKPFPSAFGFIAEGYLEIPQTGSYELSLNSDDGSRVFVDGEKVIDHWGMHSPEVKTQTLTFTKGVFPIRIEYFDAGGGAYFDLSWKGPAEIGPMASYIKPHLKKPTKSNAKPSLVPTHRDEFIPLLPREAP